MGQTRHRSKLQNRNNNDLVNANLVGRSHSNPSHHHLHQHPLLQTKGRDPKARFRNQFYKTFYLWNVPSVISSRVCRFNAIDTLLRTLLQKGNKFITLATEINEGDTFHHPQPDIDDEKTGETDQVKKHFANLPIINIINIK